MNKFYLIIKASIIAKELQKSGNFNFNKKVTSIAIEKALYNLNKDNILNEKK